MCPDTTAPARPIRVAYLGNFGPPHSTENHVFAALQNVGCYVNTYQENDPERWRVLIEQTGAYDLILWTRTGWDPPIPHDVQEAMLCAARSCDVPTVGFHLDRWWGLGRQDQVHDEPFFRSWLVVTADGGHDADWEAAGVNHHWMPPGVSLAECLRDPRPRHAPELDRAQVAFVGSTTSYHDEWLGHRRDLIGALAARFGRAFRVWERGVRGADLVDLYRTVPVIVGDSCLAGGATRYWSDRIPETLGRGGALIHPWVEGLDEHYTAEHLVTVPVGDYDLMVRAVEHLLRHPDERQRMAAAGRRHTVMHHTYERRMQQLLTLLTERGAL